MLEAYHRRINGANPAKVPGGHGDLSGVRALKQEQDAARALLASLNDAQLASAVFSHKAYRDIVSGTAESVSPMEPVGIAAGGLNPRQRDLLFELIDAYLSILPPEIARQRMAVIAQEKPDQIYFGWAGGWNRASPTTIASREDAFSSSTTTSKTKPITSIRCGATLTATSGGTYCGNTTVPTITEHAIRSPFTGPG